MKIFLAGTSFKRAYGGPAVSVPSLAASLSRLGIEVGIWAPDGSASLARKDFFREASSTVAVFDQDLDTALTQFGTPDVIHDNGIWLPHNHRLANIARKREIPRVITIRGMLEPWAIQYRPWKKKAAWTLYQKRDLQSAGVLHATSEAERLHIISLGLTSPVRVIPNGVSLPDLSSRKHFSVGTVHPTILFLGRLHPKKGIPMLLHAWAELKTKPWRLRIVGPSENGYDAELLKTISALGLEGSTELVGPKFGTEKANEYLAAQLFVLPTYSENFGISVAEAMSYGLPVITTTGAPWSIIAKKNAGWQVEPTKEALKTALASALSSTMEDLEVKGSNGRKIVHSEYSWEGIASSMHELYIEARNLTPCD